MCEPKYIAGLDGVVMVRPAGWRRPRSIVVCCLYLGSEYAAMGYVIDWQATRADLEANRTRSTVSESTDDKTGPGLNP